MKRVASLRELAGGAQQLVLDALEAGPGQHELEYQRGEIFTRPWVVDLILDLAGYTTDEDLGAGVVVEPACGEGAFLGPIIDRLINSCSRTGRELAQLEGAVRAFDLSLENVERSRKLVAARLADSGMDVPEAERLAATWVVQSDFLLEDWAESSADYVVGNPPYVRLEDVSRDLSTAYRAACPTMRGRSDIFVGFIERGLRLLRPGGTLGFIVADRWMHNDYGSSLRTLVADEFSVDAVIEMHEVDAFEDEVSAYPAVTVIRRRSQGKAVLASTRRTFSQGDAAELVAWTRTRRSKFASGSVAAARLSGWFPGDQLWPSGDPVQLAVIADLERRFPALEDPVTGTRVGIGVATGADSVFITRDPELVEQDRLLPLVTSRDIASGRVNWSGTMLVNPWDTQGLVDLGRYPRLASYLRAHESRLRNRHIGKRRPHTWYRTIDRVNPELTGREKLLLPDIKAASHPVLDDGSLYPHHNLYFVVSEKWDPEVLGGLLISRVADLFVGAYCVKMRGGCYRFQAQYLRQIRVPALEAVKDKHRRALSRAFGDRDVEAATGVACELYALDGLPSR